ncbi:MAG: SH3 domain-containing protein [Acidimicrobiales bacterium]
MTLTTRRRAAPTPALLCAAVTVAVLAGACGPSGPSPAAGRRPPGTGTTTTVATTTTLAGQQPGVQTSGVRTVLSPVGLNVRADPSTTAAVVGTAAQGTALTVLGNNATDGGWFKVKGATVTGWISASPTLSAMGEFGVYTSTAHGFGALYPASWSFAEMPPAGVVFGPPGGRQSVVVTAAANVAALGRGRSGYNRTQSEQVVVCGVTSSLVTYVRAGAATGTAPPAASATPTTVPATTVPTTTTGPTTTTVPNTTTVPASSGVTSSPTSNPGSVAASPLTYLAQIRLTLNPTHALGIDANLADLSQLQSVRDFADSVTFPFAQCQI